MMQFLKEMVADLWPILVMALALMAPGIFALIQWAAT